MKGLIFLLLISIVSCQRKNDDIPATILQPGEMREVLWDMFRADLYLREHVVTDSLKHIKSLALYSEVMKKHNTTQEQFSESFNFYRAHPALFKPMLDSLEKRGKTQNPQVVTPIPDTARKPRVFRKADTLRAQ